ncbi:hypothetical protein BDP27DRAFT_1311973 [Rhodocollybia butyracea]|uniref:Uncharacterized protein n=1 Tax=Rhodocollybia butyracea TaxID=206335 RepID=A0A9P5Q992_9AGAR|nr:hypothetical protein BDP27DRAFT_1311973 [Rhodocollybia butyracea]
MKYLFITSMLLGALSAAFAVPQVVSPACESTCSSDTDCADGNVCRVSIFCLGSEVLRCLPPITTTA